MLKKIQPAFTYQPQNFECYSVCKKGATGVYQLQSS